MKHKIESAHQIDIHVGACIKQRRKMLGLSQESVAYLIGISFQQIQKYENGGNRVSASRLYQIANVLRVPVRFFFDGLPQQEFDEADPLRQPEVLEMVRHFATMSDTQKASMINIARGITSKPEGLAAE
jgi:transcriptional regulator with XRE-family HTH domain